MYRQLKRANVSRCSAVGSALGSGPRGHGFKSRHFDQKGVRQIMSNPFFFTKNSVPTMVRPCLPPTNLQKRSAFAVLKPMVRLRTRNKHARKWQNRLFRQSVIENGIPILFVVSALHQSNLSTIFTMSPAPKTSTTSPLFAVLRTCSAASSKSAQ